MWWPKVTGCATCRWVKPGIASGGFLFGEVDQRAAELLQQHLDVVDGVAQVETDVGGDLVVARAAGMQALAGVADQRGEALLDVEVHIFEVNRPFELPGFDFLRHLRHAALNVGQILGADDALLGEHLGVRQRAANVLPPHPLVEIDRGGIALDEVGNRLGETAGPSVLIGVGGHEVL